MPRRSTIRAQSPLHAVVALVVLALFGLLATSTHTVRPGETLEGIARRHGTSVSALVRANGIGDPDRIRAGDRLVIDAGDTGSAPDGSATYTISRGDTLGSIARRHATSVADLVARNGIANPNRIFAGRTLQVPTEEGPPTEPTGSVGTTPAGAGHHVVRSGETIEGIARLHGITQEQLVAANGLVDGRVYAHQRLLLTPAGPEPSESAADRDHVVAAGESLWTIARQHGTTVRAIADANGLSDPDLLRTGTDLTIPGAGVGAAGPIECPVPGARFMNDWGFPRSGGRFHNGNDLFAPRGTPVLAPVAGTVTHTTGEMAGRQVTLVGDDGNHWFGTHLDGFGASGRVRAGDVIGYVGDSGNAVGGPTHLHLELHPGGGAPVNPYPLVLDACRG